MTGPYGWLSGRPAVRPWTGAAIAAALFPAFGLSPPASHTVPIPETPTMDPVATATPLPVIPDSLPDGVPTAARHLHAILIATAACGALAHMDDAGRAAFAEACGWLAALPSAGSPTVEANGKLFWPDEDGSLIAAGLVKPAKMLEDGFVRTVVTGALNTRATLAKLKALTFSEAQSLIGILGVEHGVEMGGKAGNVSFTTFDRRYKVQISAQDRLAVGPSIEVAKRALQDWLAEAEAGEEVRALINAAFGLDDQGRVRATELVRLRRLHITHPKWRAAMAAIDDALEVAGKAIYLRVYERRDDGRYDLIPLDLANA
ncbi:DUF3164 family protein [Azospirillum sp. RWY-5-1]|uniref:DUF3164 family protein n=1 Tax=Azospirillum oleiclasticum TaxID=2735135 RepID=A0ABX2T742_9PROT|nr:DUF3164 family protein [Azospirillum oleiclasticum]NYZ12859.1 DUF3164 family protein [Azospirillum oleiclasticum]NYZ20019.1 DUF3164 family protein [Azospirillum oleiclasticum]